MELVLTICGAIITISSAIAIIIKIVKNTITKVAKEAIVESIKDNNRDINEKLLEISKKLDDFMEETRIKQKSQDDLLISSCASRINEAYDHYTEQGWIGKYSLSILEEVFEKYTAAGGNHMGPIQMAALRELPSSPKRIRSNNKASVNKNNLGDFQRYEI